MPPNSKLSADSAASLTRASAISQARSMSLKSAAAKLVSARAASVKSAAADPKPSKLKTGSRFVGKREGEVIPSMSELLGGEAQDAKTKSGIEQSEPNNVAATPRRAMPGARVSSVDSNVEPMSNGAGVVEKKAKRMAGDEQAIEPMAVPANDASVKAGEAPRPAMASSAPMRAAVKAPVSAKGQVFKTSEFIVYPAHGVGQIVAVEEQVVAGYKLELFVISFSKDKMILKVPLPKVSSVGMRKLAEPPVVKRALDTLTGRARVKRTMWSRRAQEYEAKINSGDLVAIAEVVRDLYRSDAQPEQSYSERQLYEAALDRIARELAVVEKLTDSEALKLIDGQLQKGPRRGKPDEADSADEQDEGDDQGIVEAA